MKYIVFASTVSLVGLAASFFVFYMIGTAYAIVTAYAVGMVVGVAHGR